MENSRTGDTDEIKSATLSVRRDVLVVRVFSASNKIKRSFSSSYGGLHR